MLDRFHDMMIPGGHEGGNWRFPEAMNDGKIILRCPHARFSPHETLITVCVLLHTYIPGFSPQLASSRQENGF